MPYKIQRPHGLMFHHFHDDKLHKASQGSITQSEFIEILHYVGIENIVSADRWLDLFQSDKLQKREICITFDDALRSQYDIALPVLEDLNLGAFWFIYSSVFEGGLEKLEVYRHYRMTEFKNIDDFYNNFNSYINASKYRQLINDQLVEFDANMYLKEFPFYSVKDKEFRFIRDKILGQKRYQEIMDKMIIKSNINLSKLRKELWLNNDNLNKIGEEGNIVGLHSYSHPTAISEFSKDQQYNEYQKNLLHIEKITGVRPITMAHPCNSYNGDTLDILRDMGIVLGFRSNMAKTKTCCFEFPREDHANILASLNCCT